MPAPAAEAEEYRPAEWPLNKLDFIFRLDLISFNHALFNLRFS